MPKAPRQTDDPLGKKLLLVLREQGRADDLNYLAEQLGVTVQSTYDYIKHGRLAKERYTKLVQWSGRPLEWWFDVPPVSAPTANEVAAQYAAWPIPGMTLEQIRDALSPEQRAEVTGFLKALLGVATRTVEDQASPVKHPASPSRKPRRA